MNKNKYLKLVPTNESKGIIKNMKVCGLNEKYMKIKFISDDKLPLRKTIEIPSMIIVVRAVFP